MSRENKDLVRSFFAYLNEEHAVPDHLMTEHFEYHVAGQPPMDLEATHKRASIFISAFPDLSHTLEELIAEGDKAAFRSRLQMTHHGDFMGVSATGNRLSVVEMGMMRIGDGKIAEMWGLLDVMGILRQIEAPPTVGDT